MDGYVTIGTDLDTSGLSGQLANMKNMIDKKMTGIASTVGKTFSLIKTTVLAVGIGFIAKSISYGMNDAIKRVDTLNNFPKVMNNLGISAKDAQESVDYLSDKLTGLPTTLDDAVGAVQRFTSANGNVKASTEMFLALNNAVLAGGAPMAQQQAALEQMSQAYAKGKPDMMEWRTAMSAMPAQLKQVAIAMGYASSNELGEALRSGQVSMNEFMATLMKLNKEGANGFASLEEQARAGTGGIQTSMLNLKTAITRGLAQILDAIGQTNIAGFFQGIANAINKVIPYVVAFVKVLVTAVSMVAGLFGKKIQTGSKKVSDNIGGAGASMSNLSDSTDDVNKGLGGASKKAKELKKQLAGFDEMNVLQDNTQQASGGSGGSGGGAGGGGASLGDLGLTDFDWGLDKTNSKVDEIYKNMMDKFGKIGDIIKSVWNSDPVQAFVGFASTYIQFLYDGIKTLGLDLVNNMTMTWNNIKDNVFLAFQNMSLFVTNFFTDITTGIETWGPGIIERISGLFNSIWTDAIDPAVQFIAQAWADFTGIFVQLWDEYGKPLVDDVGETITTILDWFQMIWDDILQPIIQPFLEQLNWLWDKYLKDLITEIGAFIAKLATGAMEIFNKFISPIVKWLVKTLAPAWSALSSGIIGVLGTIIGGITGAVRNIIKILGGIIDFITGVFTGNWKKAWNGIKSIFSGIVGGLANIFKVPINLIIDGINAFLSGLNKVKIPDWVPGVGGKGFNISKIPKLAKGGIVNMPGNGVPVGSALAGERGQEGVIPLTDSQQMALLGEAIGKYITINANITNSMNGRVISRELQKIQNDNNFAYNR